MGPTTVPATPRAPSCRAASAASVTTASRAAVLRARVSVDRNSTFKHYTRVALVVNSTLTLKVDGCKVCPDERLGQRYI